MKKLIEKLEEEKKSFVEALNKNKDFWHVNQDNAGNYNVIVDFNTRTDNAIPTRMVFPVADFMNPKKIDGEDIAILLKIRTFDNQSYAPSIESMLPDMKAKISKVNDDILTAFVSYGSCLKREYTLKENNYNIQLSTALDILEENGYDSESIYKRKSDILDLMKAAVVMDANEDGSTNLKKPILIAKHILTDQFKNRLEKMDDTYDKYKVSYSNLASCKKERVSLSKKPKLS